MIQIRTLCLSPHLDSFCRKLNELRGLEFVYTLDDPGDLRRRAGWRTTADYPNGPSTAENIKRAVDCELLFEMLREMNVMEERIAKGKKTIYASERWLKPIRIGDRNKQRWRVPFPGILRLLVPGYWKMARRFVRLMDDPNFYVFAIGVPAVRDFVRMYRIFHGDWRCWFRAPEVKIERKLGGAVEGFPRMKLWAYFVEKKGTGNGEQGTGMEKVERRGGQRTLSILWIGRMLNWKRVDTLIKAFRRVAKKCSAALLLVGEGPERKSLEKLAGKDRVVAENPEWQEGKIVFHDYVKNDVARELMRQADVYVMPSNGEEGWGAAVSEALSEGCPAISTYEAGSSATLLPEANLFHAGDAAALTGLLERFSGEMVEYNLTEWSGGAALEKMLEILK